MSSSSKTRHSIVPPVVHTGPKPPVHFTSSISIADSAILIGTGLITIHSESVIHPRAKLDSTLGRVSVGRRCIIHERATLGAVPTPPPPSMPIVRGGEGMSVALGDYVIVEVGATVEGGETVIAEGTLIGVGARVGAGAKIGRHCTLTPMSEIAAGEMLPDFTVVYSNGLRRTDNRGMTELKNKGITRQIDVLRRMIKSNPQKFA